MQILVQGAMVSSIICSLFTLLTYSDHYYYSSINYIHMRGFSLRQKSTKKFKFAFSVVYMAYSFLVQYSSDI